MGRNLVQQWVESLGTRRFSDDSRPQAYEERSSPEFYETASKYDEDHNRSRQVRSHNRRSSQAQHLTNVFTEMVSEFTDDEDQ